MLSHDVKRIALRILKALEVPEADEVANFIKNGDWGRIASNKFDPVAHHDLSLDQFRRVYLAKEFLRKAEFLPSESGDDFMELQAIDAFYANEAQCYVANQHLDRFLTFPVLETAVEIQFNEILIRARAWIKNTLGPIPDVLDGRFGPGATFESKQWKCRKLMTAYDKIRNTPCITAHTSQDLITAFLWETAYGEAVADACPTRLLRRIKGNRFTTVYKDSTKRRGIAIEPGLNVFAQLAIGDHLKTRLLRRKIDLRGNSDRKNSFLEALGLELGRSWKGQAHHREMARVASRTGSHATIDLSNASDLIAYSLVKLLIPEDWFGLLCEFRSPYTHVPKKTWTVPKPGDYPGDPVWVKLEKFSSMGNGYTFELETLIFCALAHAIGANVGNDTFVYGDDIIIPDHLAADLLAVLRYSGMTPNEKKTFYGADVYFRESCGGDYFLGHDVRPFYWKKDLLDPTNYISLANSLRAWSLKWDLPKLMAVRNAVLDCIPSDIRRCRGPEELGDLVIHDTEDRWITRERDSIRYIQVWRPVRTKQYLRALKRPRDSFVYHPPTRRETREMTVELTESKVALAAALMGLPSDGLVARNTVAGFKLDFVAFS